MDLMDLAQLVGSQLLLCACAALASLLAAVSGGGGGFILLPMLIMLGLPFMVAIGTHKFSMLLIGCGNFKFGRRRADSPGLRRLPSVLMGFLGVPAVVAGTYAVSFVPARLAECALGVLSIAMAGWALRSRRLTAEGKSTPPGRAQVITGAVLIVLVGIFSGALSAGAGLFLTIILVLCFNMDLKLAIAHAVIFASVLWNFTGGVTVALVAGVRWQWLPALLLGSFIGGLLGARLLRRLSKRAVTRIFAAAAAVSGLLLILR